ncbi:MAG: 16S rRNA (guanine(966)-N(2))-methyltransferase RsmD [Acidimicrobiales bacterium]|nr:16S rRNA (guanine(966)-N(2))-methyltransferase RsmD [Acidimicrobiales bacterium]
MRVVAGTAGGRRLLAPEGTRTRPTTDRVREAVFNALGSLDAVADARVLDLFAGSGALGIEALSRGAAHATFVERDGAARRVVEANLTTTGLGGDATVVAGDALAHLRDGSGEPYDLVLLDPPHDTDRWPDLLAALEHRITEGAVVVIESDRPVVGDDDPAWVVTREKRYGGTVVQMVQPRRTRP